MKIKNRLEALHVMASMRRMELDGTYCASHSAKTYDTMYDACETFFAEHPDDVWNTFESTVNW